VRWLGFFDVDKELKWLPAASDPLERLAASGAVRAVRPALDAALQWLGPREGSPLWTPRQSSFPAGLSVSPERTPTVRASWTALGAP
jgi:hypothetical protein